MIHVGTNTWAWLKKGVVGAAVVALLASTAPAKPASAATEWSILDNGHGTVPSSTETISNKYGILAEFTPGVSELVLSGATTSKSYIDRDLIVDPPDERKGKIKARYTNIATFKGRALDFEIVVADWKKAGFAGGEYMVFYDGSIGFAEAGYDYVDLRGTYRYHDTNEPATDLPGSYMTVNDLDANQFMSFSPSMRSKIDKIYAFTNDTRVSYWTVDGYTNVGARFYEGTEDDDEEAIVTFLVSGHQFDFRWNKDWDRPTSQGKAYNKSGVINWYKESSAQYFGYIAKKPARSEMLEPSKVIVKPDGTRVPKNSVNAGSTYTYGIQHTVPDEYAKFYYTKYSMSDTLDKALSVESVKVVDGSNNDVSDRFTISQSTGNTVKATAKAAALQDPSFYKKSYTMLIKVKTPEWKDAEAYANGNHTFDISNTAYVSVDNDTKATNPVTTKVIMPFDVTVKHVHRKSGKVLATETVKRFDGEGYGFSPRTDLKNADGYSYIPEDDKDISGTVNGGDVTVTIWYNLPIGDYGIKRVEIFTKPNDDATGLRTNVTLDPKWVEALSASERDAALVDKTITLTVTDITKGEIALTKTVKLASLTDYEIKTALPVKKSGITPYDDGEKRMYSYKLSSSDPYIVARNMKLDLNGFTSSRERLYGSENASYTGPVMVERDLGKAQKINNETVTVNVPKPKPVKTGYGIPFKADVTYLNDIKTIPHGGYTVAFYTDKRLIDSFLPYTTSSVNVTKTASETLARMVMSGTTKTVGDGNAQAYELPVTMVESPSGNLFTPAQVAANDSRIKGDVKDGGRKLYVPTWLDALGDYRYVVRSADNALGANLVSFTMADKVNVEAYMFSHTDSKTQDKDELLLLPKLGKDATEASDPWFKQF